MPREMGLPKYFKYSECKEGDVLVKMGEFIGTTQGKFGDQYNFIQLGDNQHVCLNKSGSIAWRIEQDHIVEGGVYDICFGGKEVMEKGAFAGKEANTFTFATYEDSELPAAFLARRAKAPVATPVAKAPTAQAEALDGLD